MKKLALFASIFFLTHLAFAKTKSDAFLTPTNPNDLSKKVEGEDIQISDTLKIIPQTRHERNETLHYKIDIIYPQISGTHLPLAAKTFNQDVLALVAQQVNQFKTNIAEDKAHMLTLPREIQHNYFKMDYDIDVIFPQNVSIISLRLSAEGMQAGRAHPFHTHTALNFDFTHGKMLALNDLFKSHAAYLAVIAKYSQQHLSHTLKQNDQWMLAEGTKANAKNYKNWNLEEDALLITFDEYQVAPYTYGAQEVEIPYAELKNLLSSKTVVVNESNKKVG